MRWASPLALLLGGLLASAAPAAATPIVIQDVSGNAGDYIYTLFVTNTDPLNDITVFGITAPLPIILDARPAGWTTQTFPSPPQPPLLADFCSRDAVRGSHQIAPRLPSRGWDDANGFPSTSKF